MSEGTPRRPRVRPYPLSELPRLLQVQAELGRVLMRHLGPVIDAVGGTAAESAWEELERTAGGPLSLVLQEPYLFPEGGAGARARGGAALELELLGPAPRRAVLVVAEALWARLGDDQGLKLLRQLLDGAPVRVGGPVGVREVAGILGGPGQMAIGLDLLLSGPEGTCWARLLCGADLRLAAPPALGPAARARLLGRRERLERVPVVLRIEAGVGLLSAEAVAALAASDVVVLDRFGPRPVVGGPVRLRLDGPAGSRRGAFPGHLDGGGVTLTGPFSLEGTSMMGTDHPNTSDESAERLLRELPVELTCEIGRVTLTGREVLELRPGVVLPVGRPLAGPVDLCAGGRVIARGELVDVEGEIGVRVTELLD